MPPVATEPGAQRQARAHRRFARGVLIIYLGVAVLSVTLLLLGLLTDRSHQIEQTRHELQLETEVRASNFGSHLSLLTRELHRLGLRSEVNLLDQNVEPERSLLALSHQKSTFFNVGIAILSVDGRVVWSEPSTFLPRGQSYASERWFGALLRRRRVLIVPVRDSDARRTRALAYVVSPIVRQSQIAGVLLGGIDLARRRALRSTRTTILASRLGRMIYHPQPEPPWTKTQAWLGLFPRDRSPEPLSDVEIGKERHVVAVAPVGELGLVLASIEPERRLYAPANARLRTRMAIGLSVTSTALIALVVLLTRSLRGFRRAEEEALRDERLRLVGEATNAIAHEIKNALNGLQLGLDVVLRQHQRRGDVEASAGRDDRTVRALRAQLARLTEFTTELLTFSKGLAPRPVEIEVSEFVAKVASLNEDLALELNVKLQIEQASEPLHVLGDPTLLHLVISNLLSNAFDAVSSGSAPIDEPRIVVSIEKIGDRVLVKVADNGAGVPDDVRGQLFEPFVSGKSSGVGIGLALSRRIARAHDGELALISSSAGGAIFQLELPILGHQAAGA